MKRKVFAQFSVVVLMIVVLSSCNNASRSMFKADNGIEFDTINLNRKHFLDDKPENPSCNLTVAFVYPKNIAHFDVKPIQDIFTKTTIGAGYDSLSAREATERYAENYIKNYKNDARIYKTNKPAEGDYLSDDLHADDDYNNAYLPKIFYSYSENISDSIVYNGYGIVSYQVRQSNSKGGKMSYETRRNHVVELSTGNLITESDVFVPGYDIALRPIIQNALLEQNSVKSIKDLEDLGFFGIDEIMPNSNFLITENGMVYTFNKGEYSAYRLSAPEIFIPFETLRSLLRENTSVSKLSNLP